MGDIYSIEHQVWFRDLILSAQEQEWWDGDGPVSVSEGGPNSIYAVCRATVMILAPPP